MSVSLADVGQNAQANKLEIRDAHGVRTESHQSHFERFKEAFVKELQDFTDSVLDDTRELPPFFVFED